MQMSIEFGRKLLLAYNATCKPLCQKLKLPQTAFDILMFLANNPAYRTARDIVELRNIKANLVSVNVDKLVQEGYLVRKAVKGDRRKTELLCTEKAWPVIEQGRALQEGFAMHLCEGMSEAEKMGFARSVAMMEKNLDEMGKGEE